MEKIAERVRALLAKAESTEFPPEALALTVKAQELMARYAIDQAYLRRTAPGTGVINRQIVIPRPYQTPKVLLLSQLARANHCRAVWIKESGSCAVFGTASDVDGVELLFTSLLVQAATAMVTGRGADAADTRSYRRSFLAAYANRIRDRLEEISARVVEEATREHGRDLLPVLAARKAEVEHAVTAQYPHLGSVRVRSWNSAGWDAGRAAADRATLNHDGQLRAG